MDKASLICCIALGCVLVGAGTSLAQDVPAPSFPLPKPEVGFSTGWKDLPLPERAPELDLRWSASTSKAKKSEKTRYGMIVVQSLMFLGVEHGFRLMEEKKTRQQLSGRFFHDWFASVENLHGWNDGGSFFSNWVCHPVQGSVSAFIYAQNNPQSRRAKFGANKDYIHGKTKQFIFSYLYSLQFEIGPISECSIGNLGQSFGPESWQQRGQQAYIDQVVTPVIGTAWSIGEDLVDQKFLRPFMEDHRFLGKLLCGLLNPTRMVANAFAFHSPWYRP